MDKKELKSLLATLRSNGVLRYKCGDLELELHPDAMKLKREATDGDDIGAPPSDNKWSNFPTGELSPEQMMYYSAGGTPEEDPFRTDRDDDGGDA